MASIDEVRQNSHSPATLRAYRTDWRLFTEWCAARGVDSLPAAPETIAAYVADLAGVRAVATIQRRLTSISVAHQAAGHESPTRSAVVWATWKGTRRTFGLAARGKAPLLTDDVRAMAGALGDRLIDVRDRALVLLGFAGALRRTVGCTRSASRGVPRPSGSSGPRRPSAATRPPSAATACAAAR